MLKRLLLLPLLLPLLLLLLVLIPAWANTTELPAGGSIDGNLAKGKTTIVEFYADW